MGENGAQPPVLLGREGGVATITLNNPRRKNAMTHPAWLLLRESLAAVAASDARVLVVTGVEGDFCAGADLFTAKNGWPGAPEPTRPIDGPGCPRRPSMHRSPHDHTESNEVDLHDARIPHRHRLGDVGQGWRVVMTTLMNERRAIGGGSSLRGSGSIGAALKLWRERPDLRTSAFRDRLTLPSTTADAARLAGDRQRVESGDRPIGPEGSIGELVGAELNQEIYEFCMDMPGIEATLYGSYEPPVGEVPRG